MEILEQIWHAIRTSTLPDLGVWSYVILFVLIFVEGPAITMTAGAMAGAGILRFELVFIVAVVGNTVADYTWYILGRFGAHQPHEHVGKDNLVYAAWFSGGLRIIDISSPYRPEEVGHYIPAAREGCGSLESQTWTIRSFRRVRCPAWGRGSGSR